MKKNLLFTTVLFLVISSAVNAQITKGSTFIGGSLNFNSNSSEYPNSPTAKSTSFMVSPAIGKAIKDNLVGGIKLSYSHLKGGYETNSYGGGFFIRKYIPVFNRVFVFGEASIGGNINRSTYTNNNFIETKGWSVNLSVAPGISFAVTKSLFLDLSLNGIASFTYGQNTNTDNNNNNNKYKSSSFSFSSNIQNQQPFSFGINFIIPKK